MLLPLAGIAQPQGPAVRWQRDFTNYPWISAADLVRDGSGSMYVTGEIQTDTRDDLFVAKYSVNGDSLWTHQFGSDSLQEVIGRACLTSDDRICVAGYVMHYNGDPDFPYIACLDTSGDLLWETSLPYVTLSAWAIVIAPLPEGAVVIAVRGLLPSGRGGIVAIRLNAEGDTTWARAYTSDDLGYQTEQAFGISTSPSGRIALVGSILDFPSEFGASSLILVESSGQLAASRSFTATANLMFLDVIYADSGWWVTGFYDDPNAELRSTYLLRTNENGDSLGSRVINRDLNVSTESIILLPNHELLIAGSCTLNAPRQPGVFIERLDSQGEPVWRNLYGGSFVSFRMGVASDNEGRYYVAADLGFPHTFSLIATETDTINLASESRQTGAISQSWILSGIYPNPFNATTTISFTLPKASYVDLSVYDVTGRLVRRLAGGHMGPPLQAGSHDIAFDGGDLPSGIYFVTLQSGEVAQTRKMVLLK